jgi:sirohydrochlorin ferrochelatase
VTVPLLRLSGPRAAGTSAAGPSNDPPALLAIGHGSRDPRHAASLRRLAEAAQHARPDVRVEVGFLDLCGPDVPTALERLVADGAHSVVVLPLFLAHGYHVRHDVPNAVADAVARVRNGLGRGHGRGSGSGSGHGTGGESSSGWSSGSGRAGASSGSRRNRGGESGWAPHVAICAPLGPDPLLCDAMDARLREAGVWPTDPGLGLIVASAGSSSAAAVEQVEAVARNWGPAATAYAAVPPTTAQAIARLRARGFGDVAVASYFLAPGRLPDRVRADAHAAGIPIAAPLTTPDSEPPAELVQLVLARYKSAAAGGCRLRAGIAAA